MSLPSDTRTLGVVRRILAVILLAAFVGTLVELILLEHTEDSSQIIPLALLGAGALMLAVTVVQPVARAFVVFRGLMVLLIAAGVLGVGLHFNANLEFQRELSPDSEGGELLWQAVWAKTPPALAPGVLVQLGCLGLVYAFRAPVRGGGQNVASSSE